MNIPLGWKRDPVDDRDWSFKDSPIATLMPIVPADEVDLRLHLPKDCDLQKTQDCCAHGVRGQAIAGASILYGSEIKTPSVHFLYANARLLDKPNLIDDGSFLRLMYKSIAPNPAGASR